MITTANISRPQRLQGLHQPPAFIPPNSKDYLLEVDLGFASNPLYRQEKLCCFIPDQVYYQKFTLEDGRGNAIKEDVRSIIITGQFNNTELVRFSTDIYPRLSSTTITPEEIRLPFYPELNTELFVRAKEKSNAFLHFSCAKIIYREGADTYLQLRHIGSYYYAGMLAVLSKWHPEIITNLPNIPEEL